MTKNLYFYHFDSIWNFDENYELELYLNLVVLG